MLLSGGVDSVSVAFWKRPAVALTVDYGQLAAEAEIEASRKICCHLGIRHEVLDINCRAIGAGCMLGSGQKSSLNTHLEWWPFRNQLLVTFAAARAVLIGINTIIIGSVVSDQRHLDGTGVFMARMAQLLASQEGEIRLEAPAIEMASVDLVRESRIPRELLAWAYSCHTGIVVCGSCPGCVKNSEVWSVLEHAKGSLKP